MADAGTSYSIDIEAEVQGGGAAAAELMDLADSLDSTSAAADAAAASLAAGEKVYGDLEKKANSAAKRVESLSLKLAEAQEEQHHLATTGDSVNIAAYRKGAENIEKLARQLQRAKPAADSLAASLKTDAAVVDALRSKATSAARAHKKMADAQRAAAKAAMDDAQAQRAAAAAAKKNAAANALASKRQSKINLLRRKGTGDVGPLAESLTKLGGPLGRTGGKAAEAADAMKKLRGSLGNARGGAVAAVVVITLLVAAITAVTVVTAKWAVTQADANRSMALTVKAVEATSDNLLGLSKIIPSVARETGLLTEDIVDLAKQLDAAKVSAKDMPVALRAAAQAERALGKGGAAKFLAQVKAGKKSVAELAGEIDRKFGGIVDKRLTSLDGTSRRLKQNLADTFGGLNIEGLLTGLASMVGLLDQNTSSGKGLKFIFETLFQPIIDGVANVIPKVIRGFLKIQIFALKTIIVFKKLKNLGVFKALSFAIKGVATFLALPLIPLKTLIAAISFLGSNAEGVWESIKSGASGLGDAVSSAAGSIADSASDMAEQFANGLKKLLDISKQLGKDIIDGLVVGIQEGAAAVVSAITGVVQGGIDAAKALLKISSPSKVFEDIGQDTSAGMEQGVEKGAPGVQTSLEKVVSPPSDAGSGTVSGKAGGNTFTFNFYGIQGTEDLVGRVRDVMTSVLEGDVLELGGEGAPA
jgi:hypothetical protein